MTTTEHTPGPWELELIADLEDGENIEIYDKDGFAIAKIEGSPVISKWSERFPEMQHWADGAEDGRTQRERPAAEILANAHLLLAAPDLLVALEQMDALMEMLWNAVPWGQTFNLNIMLLNEAPVQAKQAIAKARNTT